MEFQKIRFKIGNLCNVAAIRNEVRILSTLTINHLSGIGSVIILKIRMKKIIGSGCRTKTEGTSFDNFLAKRFLLLKYLKKSVSTKKTSTHTSHWFPKR